MKKAAFCFCLLMAAALSARAVDSPVVHTLEWPFGQSSSEAITMVKDTSHLMRFDRPVIRAAVSNPDICDITNIGDREILVNAKEAGVANLLVWDQNEDIATYHIDSTLDLERLRKVLLDIDPTADLKILPYNQSAAVYGTVETSLKMKQIQETVKAFDKNAMSFVKLQDPKQVLLEVRFAEIDRTKSKEFKLDLFGISKYFNVGIFPGQTGASTSLNEDSSFTPKQGPVEYSNLPAIGSEVTSSLYASYISNRYWLQNFLRWLEEKNVLKIIARPNLLTKDGEEAEFKVGGEFPIPTVQSQSNSVTITYKEFGTLMKFTPEVLDEGVIRLKIEAEVSELDFTTNVTSGGVTVPGLKKRTEKTVAELRDEQTLVIGGFISQRITANNRKVPKLGDIPLLGKLFNADDYEHVEVELVVVITPHIVRPMELKENKILFEPNQVKEAIQIYRPAEPDEKADLMTRMMTQNELMADRQKEELNVRQFESSISRRYEKTETKTEFPRTESVKAKETAKRTWPAESNTEESATQTTQTSRRAPATNFIPANRSSTGATLA